MKEVFNVDWSQMDVQDEISKRWNVSSAFLGS